MDDVIALYLIDVLELQILDDDDEHDENVAVEMGDAVDELDDLDLLL